MVIAGEVSGDMHAAKMLREIKAVHPDWTFWGVGGAELEKEGVDCLYGLDDFAVLGLVEVLKKYGFFKKAFNHLVAECRSRRPDAVLLVDYPGFNLRFAKEVKGLGIPVVYYVCPQIWAWKAGRADTMSQVIDQLLVIFPFEVGLFKDKPLDVHYVGHPLVDETQKALAASDRDLPWPGETRVALLPGSRRQEIERNLPVILDTAQEVAGQEAGAGFILAAPSESIATLARAVLDRHPVKTRVSVVVDDTREVLKQATAAVVASGTATLETALMRCPMVIVYKTSWFTYTVGRRVVKIPHIGMVNVVAGKEVCPEFIQGDATPGTLAKALLPLLEDTDQRRAMLRDMTEVTKQLSDPALQEDAVSLISDLLV